jgi:negative regulator of flagellin synthesis FlgM
MKILGSSDVAHYIRNRTLTENAPVVNSNSSPEDIHRETRTITVSLSQKSKDGLKAREAIGKVSDIRAEKIESIKEKLKAGTYEVEADQIADKLLEHH